MNFNLIDTDRWARKSYFEHYLNQVRCTYSMTADIDITLLRTELKRQGIKLYPALIHMITTVVNRYCEFRTCFDSEGRLGYWDHMSPSFTIFHEEDRTFSSIWTPYSEEFMTFYVRYLHQTETYKNAGQLFPDPHEPPNTFPISSIPWVAFTGFNLNIYTEGTYLLPIFTIGKYHSRDNTIRLPLSAQFHHAVCDGYHAGLLFNELQEMADGCMEWLEGAGSNA
ncbi:chloramphenicol O-acetyltransferase type A [Paenibacillus sp. UNCCL117]|uniref:type A chloramphenicol O-acetyltransferase n=1 Tax=unclassified Paenibacillus TaxID=185978 RepID=UPI000891C536|nr:MULTISPECIES: type A chloramphenicol O-acetyltransferase [unclassified Paenibacillus]SDD16507.1 chloramphenicol O-acetyltransferase type A [Paenibacillus sp. cl123]SFW34734.1 chloramphenicol O-acetyltransferase type A [Paenibacillus sp. UNCCL117]